jgi:cellulase/cellobiase CelA1
LGNPVGENMEFAPAPTQPPVDQTPTDPADPVDPPSDPDNTSAVTFAVADTWNGGFTGNLTIRNTGPSAISGWTLEFTFAGQIEDIWNATILSQEDDRYVITNADWSGDIAVDSEVTVGFTVVGSDDATPFDIVLNGEELLS